MKVADFIVDFLIKKGVTDVFGIPGEVMLDFLDALHQRNQEISAHLSYHEQAAGFAACGYAQTSNNLCVAYSTKGPGITNMITPIADAFCDSIPVLFFTAHSNFKTTEMRFESNQEFDTIQMLTKITKYAVRITKTEDVVKELECAYNEAISGRKGPVFIDINTRILKSDINENIPPIFPSEKIIFDTDKKIIDSIRTSIQTAKRPIILIGDGIRLSTTEKYLLEFTDKIKLPVISSRFSQDIMPTSSYYFGFVGSHGTRYSNFILSKCDLVIALGNRLSYNADSFSFSDFVKQARIIRIDIDDKEFSRRQPNCIDFHTNLNTFMPALAKENWNEITTDEWINVCYILKDELSNLDIDYPISIISSILEKADNDWVIVSDVGNNEFWLSRAYAFVSKPNRILFSKSFGALGCSLPKAIGAYHFTKKRVLCFTGDQGIQMNLQELQYISHHQLPITILIINNSASGMIRDKQASDFNSRFFHTTLNSGYSIPDFCAIAHAFSIPFHTIKNETRLSSDIIFAPEGPNIIEIKINESIGVFPQLPKDHLCQDFKPSLDSNTFHYLNNL